MHPNRLRIPRLEPGMSVPISEFKLVDAIYQFFLSPSPPAKVTSNGLNATYNNRMGKGYSYVDKTTSKQPWINETGIMCRLLSSRIDSRLEAPYLFFITRPLVKQKFRCQHPRLRCHCQSPTTGDHILTAWLKCVFFSSLKGNRLCICIINGKEALLQSSFDYLYKTLPAFFAPGNLFWSPSSKG